MDPFKCNELNSDSSPESRSDLKNSSHLLHQTFPPVLHNLHLNSICLVWFKNRRLNICTDLCLFSSIVFIFIRLSIHWNVLHYLVPYRAKAGQNALLILKNVKAFWVLSLAVSFWKKIIEISTQNTNLSMANLENQQLLSVQEKKCKYMLIQR